jgi:macrodomain Ter protein organizer (MatP/YcbG family)
MAQEPRGISLDAELWKRVQEWANKEGRSLSNAVERLLTIQMDQIDKEKA